MELWAKKVRHPEAIRCLSRRVQVLAFRYKPQSAVGCMLWQGWSQRGSYAMDKLVADIIVETLRSAGVKHCYDVVGDTLNLIARSLDKSEIEWGR